MSPVLWAALIGAIVPVITDLLTTANASATVKAWVNALAASVAGALSGALSSGQLDRSHWQLIIATALTAFVTATASFHGLYKPSGASQAISRATPSFGIGPKGRHLPPMATKVMERGGIQPAAQGVVTFPFTTSAGVVDQARVQTWAPKDTGKAWWDAKGAPPMTEAEVVVQPDAQ